MAAQIFRKFRISVSLRNGFWVITTINMAEEAAEVNVAPAETENETPKEPEPEPVEAAVEQPPEEPTQRTVVLTGHGGYNKLKVEKRAIPKATEGHIVVKVHAWWVCLLCFHCVSSVGD